MAGPGARPGFWARLLGRRGAAVPAETSPESSIVEPPTYAGPLNGQPHDLRLPDSLGLDGPREAWLRDLLWSQVVVGRTEVEDTLEIWQDDLGEQGVTDAQATQAFAHVLRARKEQQAAWPADVARTPLLAAFDELETVGVVARADFSCCGTCASAEIGDERDDTRQWRGYVWFHQQDTESLLEDRSTYIGYGVFLDAYLAEDAWESLDDAAKDETYERLVRTLVQDEVAPVLERHGITVTWDGDLGRRILLEGVDHYVAV